MKTVLKDIKLPSVLEVDGEIKVLSNDITFDKEPYTGKLKNAYLHSKLLTTAIIEGVVIEFESNISHKLTDKELDDLMIKLHSKSCNDNANTQ